MSESNQSNSLLTIEECLKNFKYTRDFDLYLDMLNRLKSKYLIVLCLKSTTGQNISEQTAEKIRSFGFSQFTTEPGMKYLGIVSKGVVSCDSPSAEYKPPSGFEGTISGVKLFISFKDKEAEIRINGTDQSLNDKGINIAVYDLKKAETIDVSCCNACKGNPTFYHRNFYYDEQYIKSHIYMPESYIESVTLPLRRSYFSNRKLNVKEVERGIFLPTQGVMEVDKYTNQMKEYKAYGGICDENFNFIAGHQLFNTRDIDLDARHISDSYKVEPEKITYADETVLYGGTLTEHPGHLIVECFADRLWWIAQNADSDIKIAIEIIWGTGKAGSAYNSFVAEMLEAFGIPRERVIIITGPVMFKKIIVPDQCAVPLNYCFPYEFTKEYILPFQHITKQLAPGKYKKIYLTKSKALKSNVVGEEYFIDFFEKRGFKIIHPEDYTMKEKAELMYGADEVVTIDGTSSLFTVFCKPTVRLTILTRRMDFWDTPQQLITEALGIKDFFLVNTSGNFLDNFSDDAFINYARGMTIAYATKEFKEYVKYVFNEELDITPEESLKKHLFDYLTYFPEYYSKFPAFSSVSNIKMTDILRSMSEVFLGKKLDTGDLVFLTDEELSVKRLELQLKDERETNAERIKQVSDKAKELVDEITSLKQSLAQRDAEIDRLRKENSELSSYMAEISQLLDALEAQSSPPPEE